MPVLRQIEGRKTIWTNVGNDASHARAEQLLTTSRIVAQSAAQAAGTEIVETGAGVYLRKKAAANIERQGARGKRRNRPQVRRQGRTGLNISGRVGLSHLMEDAEAKRADFSVLLVHDVSCWVPFRAVAPKCSTNDEVEVPASCTFYDCYTSAVERFGCTSECNGNVIVSKAPGDAFAAVISPW